MRLTKRLRAPNLNEPEFASFCLKSVPMSDDPLITSLRAAPRVEEPKLDGALSRPENQNWWLLGHSIFVVALLTLVVIPFSIPSFAKKVEIELGIKATDVVLGLVILVVLFDLFAA